MTQPTHSRLAAACLALTLVTGGVALTGCANKPGTGADTSSTSSSATASSSSSSAGSSKSSSSAKKTLDLEAHRGGRGEHTEESLQGFKEALHTGVTTLELDIVLSKDNVPVIWHDPIVLASKCTDAAGNSFVGQKVHDLTWAQLQTLTCDKKLDNFKDQEQVEGNKMIQLSDLFALTKKMNADVHFNIETKVEGEHRDWSATPEESVAAILKAVADAGVADQVMIQSFDWRTLPLVKKTHPNIPTVMLWDETTWKGYSMWTGDVDYDAVDGDIIKAAKQIGADVLSPGYTVPYGLTPKDKNFKLVADKDFIAKAHKAGLTVVPWTINDEDAMREQMKAGADGIITDYPTKLRHLMQKEGYALPKPYTD